VSGSRGEEQQIGEGVSPKSPADLAVVGVVWHWVTQKQWFGLSRGGHEVAQPSSICGYEILAELGRGTTGVVYKARHPVVAPDRLVALKMPSLGSGVDAGSRLARYHNEWNALRVLTWEPDPAIPTLYNVGGDAAGQNHYVREFIEGGTLKQLVESSGVGLRQGIRVLSTITRAVQRMHGRGIAHCNLRGSTVLVRSDGTPKLIGFGHVWPLAGAGSLPPGISGVSADVDVLALQEILAWLCSTLRQPVPAPLETVRQPGSVRNLGRFAEALGSYVVAW
jgi:serine/threonine protein kinase